jgi:hypothetical protein
MHAQPPRTLKRLLKQYGHELIDDPRRTEALLRDLCGKHTREIFVLVNAQKQRIPSELLAAPVWMPRQATHSRLSRLLQTKLALTESAADWAVTAWADALELQEPPTAKPLWGRLMGQQPTTTHRKGRRTKPARHTQPALNPALHARTLRARAADLGWRGRLAWPGISQSWAGLLPWVALVSATLVLLAVVYWMAQTPLLPARADTPAEITTTAGTPENAAQATPASAAPPKVVQTGAPASLMPAPTYLAEILTLPTPARISANYVNIRQGPSLNDNAFGALAINEGVQVVAFSADGRWSQLAQPRSGWVSNEYLHFESQDGAIATFRIQVRAAESVNRITNVYTAPRMDAAVAYQLAPSLALVVAAEGVGSALGWVKVAAPVTGWMSATDLVSTTP